MRLIFLVGMPGAGKTHWGRLWSSVYNLNFIDLDEQVADKAGMAIPEIFNSIGEPGFRKLEAAVLRDVVAQPQRSDTIIAVGGGTPAFDSNMDTMLLSGCVIYLKADINILVSQIEGSRVIRPLLQDSGVSKPTLEHLYELRKQFYERANFTFDVEQLRTNTFAQILEACTSRQS